MQNIFDDLAEAREQAVLALKEIEQLRDLLPNGKYQQLSVDFQNLAFAARCWEEMAKVFYNYVRFFDEKNAAYKEALFAALEQLKALDAEGRAALGDDFYCSFCDVHAQRQKGQNIADFIAEVTASFVYEERARAAFDAQGLTDYVLCGSGCEGHALQKEVNFSDTLLLNDELVRITGNRAGMDWSTITAHGWFSYRMRVKKNTVNRITVTAGSTTDTLKMKVTVGTQEFVIDQKNAGKNAVTLTYAAGENEEFVTVKFDKISVNMPLIYTVCID